MKIGVVGPCGSGKTTLVSGLTGLGLHACHIAQEHSYVPDMWQRLSRPDILVYLHVSYPLTIARRKLVWTITEYQEQLHRLRHARQNAQLFIDTDDLTSQEVLQHVQDFLVAQSA